MPHLRHLLPGLVSSSLTRPLLVALALCATMPAAASEMPDPASDRDGVASLTEPGDDEGDDAKRRKVFRLFPARRSREERRAEKAEEAEPEPLADSGSGEGIWEWVDRMDGEIPSPEAVEELEEHEAEELAEQAVIDGADAPSAELAAADDPLFLQQIDLSEFDIPVDVNPQVIKWMEYITGNGRKYYAKWLSRSTRYRPMMHAELEKRGLPRDLVYVSMIESGYSTHAYSTAAAAGLWQFIPSTARLYDLRVDWWVDERRDPEMSLAAASSFLTELHRMFGDWRLAWAAYNTGPGRVRRAVSRAGSQDFWDLVEGGHLPKETSNYVPMIMAAAIIGKHPERYGFTDIAYQEPLAYEVEHVDGSVELEILAECAGTDLSELKALNPHLRRYATPPQGADVRLPVGSRGQFVAALAKVPKDRRITVARHTVARGETLSAIAGRYGVSVSDLTRANSLKNANRIYVGMSLVVPRHGEAVPPAASDARRTASSSSSGSSSSAPRLHTVKSGDTLSTIGARYGVSVATLKASNDLKSDTIRVGQTITVHGGSASGATSSRVATRSYTVKAGDSLSVIASRHGVSVADMQKWNNIRNPSQIRVGQTLSIGGSSAGWSSYTVKRGDSLGAIATRSRCTVKDLQDWNGLRSTVIHPGQTLRVRM